MFYDYMTCCIFACDVAYHWKWCQNFFDSYPFLVWRLWFIYNRICHIYEMSRCKFTSYSYSLVWLVCLSIESIELSSRVDYFCPPISPNESKCIFINLPLTCGKTNKQIKFKLNLWRIGSKFNEFEFDLFNTRIIIKRFKFDSFIKVVIIRFKFI